MFGRLHSCQFGGGVLAEGRQFVGRRIGVVQSTIEIGDMPLPAGDVLLLMGVQAGGIPVARRAGPRA